MAAVESAMKSHLAITSDRCPVCFERMTETGCPAPGCSQLRCVDCEFGCDITVAEDSGECAKAIDATERARGRS